MAEAQAYLLTWTTYGTWLRGDERGSVDDDHRTYGLEYVPPSPELKQRALSRLVNAPFRLRAPARRIVRETITRHCTLRQWRLLGINVRTNHIHVVLQCPDVTPERALAQLKAWCTRSLRVGNVVSPTDRLWTHHGSTRYLWKYSEIQAALHYVYERQGDDLD